MAFTPQGTPLGLLNVQCWARDPAQAGKKHRRHQLPIEEKESLKWLVSYRAVAEAQKLCSDTMLISVGDCEADLYELFHEAARNIGVDPGFWSVLNRHATDRSSRRICGSE